jgi:hypothetical protein
MAFLSYSGSNALPSRPRTITSAAAGGISNLPYWGSWTFANGVVGVVYLQQFDLSPAAAPTTYTLVSGSLPTGLSLSNISGDIGQLAGTPTVAGASSFTLRATNSYGTADHAFTLTVTAGGSGGAFTFAG